MTPYRTEPDRTIEEWRPVVVMGEVRIEGRLDTQSPGAGFLTSAVLDCLGHPMRAMFHDDLDVFDAGMVLRTRTGSRYLLGTPERKSLMGCGCGFPE